MLAAASCEMSVNDVVTGPSFASQFVTNSNMAVSISGSTLITISAVPANVGVSCQQNQPAATVQAQSAIPSSATASLVLVGIP
jgi:hypothetical protein